eukprot:scaffold90542_cov49-Cyclotella_meneghiniana.AAC.2
MLLFRPVCLLPCDIDDRRDPTRAAAVGKGLRKQFRSVFCPRSCLPASLYVHSAQQHKSTKKSCEAERFMSCPLINEFLERTATPSRLSFQPAAH